MAFEFKRTRIDKIPREALLAELERVAEHQEFVEFGERDFDREARVGSSTVVRTFGAWSKAMEALRGRLRRRGVEHRARGGPAAAGSPESATSRQKSKLRPARPEARRGSREVPAGLRLKVMSGTASAARVLRQIAHLGADHRASCGPRRSVYSWRRNGAHEPTDPLLALQPGEGRSP